MHNWLNRAIIYHIFIDRFAGYPQKADPTKPAFCGGNIKAIAKKIDHIKEIGANTILLSPFYETSAYHGYHITNFRETDKRYGSLHELKDLIKECKSHDIRVIADIVPNHCSIEHPWFIEAKSNKNSPYINWFYFHDWPNNYLSFMGFGELPKLNLENTETRKEMIDSLLQWAKLGFDGFRIDHVIGLPEIFLTELKNSTKNINSDFVLIGEAWSEGMRHKYLKTIRLKGKQDLWKNGFQQVSIQKAYEGIIDGVFDFGWRELILKNLGLLKTGKEKIQIKIDQYNKKFNENISLVRFLDNHDTNRIMFMCKNDKKLFTDLMTLLFAQNSPISIYYGTESGMNQTSPLSLKVPFSDLHARNTMKWDNSFQYLPLLSDLSKKRNAGKL